ncbi:hypothetical protein Pst134EB_023687 [Puccinia striiformis f. sp. tritici]|nr:hypothetical protein Pst134EB_023687 [Puccinia striiformis f. sp. tritici]
MLARLVDPLNPSGVSVGLDLRGARVISAFHKKKRRPILWAEDAPELVDSRRVHLNADGTKAALSICAAKHSFQSMRVAGGAIKS